MPRGTVWPSAPGPGPLPPAADANLSAEAEGAAEPSQPNERRTANEEERHGRARPLRAALPREARRRAGCGPTRDRRAPAHPRAGPRAGGDPPAGHKGPRAGAAALGGFSAVPREVPRSPTHPGPAPEPRVSLRPPVPRLITSDGPASGLRAPRLPLALREPSPAPGGSPRELGSLQGRSRSGRSGRLCACAPAPSARPAAGRGGEGEGGDPGLPVPPAKSRGHSFAGKGGQVASSQGNQAAEGKAFLKEGGRVGMLDGLTGGPVCLFFPWGGKGYEQRERPGELAKRAGDGQPEAREHGEVSSRTFKDLSEESGWRSVAPPQERAAAPA